MRSNPTPRLAWLAAVIVLVTVTWGCARSKPPRLEPASVPDTTLAPARYAPPVVIARPAPPQPSGSPIGRDPSMSEIRPQLTEWTDLWAAAQPGFAIDSTWRVRRGHWTPAHSRRAKGPRASQDIVTFSGLRLRSPDWRYTLVVTANQANERTGDQPEPGLGPDSQCGLIDHESGREAILQQCGTACGFDWGVWLSSDEFAVGGWGDVDDEGKWKQGRLWIYSIADATVAEYETRVVSVDAYERYLAAWNLWLLDRSRTLKREQTRS